MYLHCVHFKHFSYRYRFRHPNVLSVFCERNVSIGFDETFEFDPRAHGAIFHIVPTVEGRVHLQSRFFVSPSNPIHVAATWNTACVERRNKQRSNCISYLIQNAWIAFVLKKVIYLQFVLDFKIKCIWSGHFIKRIHIYFNWMCVCRSIYLWPPYNFDYTTLKLYYWNSIHSMQLIFDALQIVINYSKDWIKRVLLMLLRFQPWEIKFNFIT